MAVLLLAAAIGHALAAPRTPQSLPAPEDDAHYRIHAADGTVVAEGALSDAQPSVAVFGAAGGPPATFVAQSSDRPTRMLVRLHGEPLAPFLAQQRRRIAGDARELSRLQAEELERRRIRHASDLQRAQQTLGSELQARGTIKAVHAGFIHLSNTLSVTAFARNIEVLRRDPRVAAVHPDHTVHATLSASVPLINAPAVWAMEDPDGDALTGEGMTIAIIDTGIDYRHPDLGGCLGPGCKVAGGHDFVGQDADPLDDHGHGTHVAGIAAADGVLRGVAPHATLLGYKVLDAVGSGLESNVIAALERAVDPDQDPLTEDRADVINLSLGGPGAPDSPTSEAADNAVLAGSIVVVAAGNSGAGAGTILSPGNARRAITVAASEDLDRVADFSSRGPVIGHEYVKPDVSAPGVQILSTWGAAGYERLSGTSMAAPHVAGGVALLRQRDPAASPEAIRWQLAAGARGLDADVFAQGAGGLDLFASVEATLLADPPVLSFGAVHGAQALWQATQSLRLRNVGAESETVTLTAPAALPAGTQLTFSPVSFTLAPEELREVQATLTVDTNLVPYPDTDTLHFEGDITSSSGSGLRVPMVFRRFESLTLTVEGAPGTTHAVYLHRLDNAAFQRSSYGDEFNPIHRFELRPGAYYAQALIWAGDAWGLVYRDPFDVPGAAEDTLSFEEAVHHVHVSGIVDEAGGELGDYVLPEYHVFEAIDSTRKSGFYFFDNAPGASLFRLSDVPDFIATRTSSSYFDLRSGGGEQVRYMLSDARAPGQPIGDDWPVGLDARSAGKVRFSYRDTHRLGLDPLSAQADMVLLSSENRGGFRGIGMSSGTWPTSEPVRMTVFAPISGPTLDSAFVDMTAKLDAFPEPNVVGWTPVAASGMLGFPEPGRYARIEAVDWTTGEVTAMARPQGPALAIDDGPIFFASRFFFQWPHSLLTFNEDVAVFRPWHPMWKDSSHNEFLLDTDYTFTCADGATEVAGRMGGSVFAPLPSIEVPFECIGKPVELRVTQSVDVLDTGEPSEVHIRMRPSGNVWLPAPHLHELALLDDGVPSRQLQGSSPQVRLRWLPAYFDGPPRATLEYRLDEATAWTVLPLQLEADGAAAALPMLDTPHVASLRVTLRGTNGDFEQQTLNAMFLLGGPADFRDGFEGD